MPTGVYNHKERIESYQIGRTFGIFKGNTPLIINASELREMFNEVLNIRDQYHRNEVDKLKKELKLCQLKLK